MMRRFARQGGYSIAEMLVALAIGLVAVGGVGMVLVSSAGIYRVSDGRARIQEHSRFSLGLMEQDIRMAGFMGCFNADMFPSRFVNLVRNPGDFENAYAFMIGGHEAGAASWSPALDPGIGQGGHAPVAGSDVLVVRGPSGRSLPLSDTMVTTSVPIPLASVEGLEVGGLAIVADCSYANLFVVTQIPADKKVVHAASKNVDPKLTRVFSNTQGATVTPVVTASYFVAASGSGAAGRRSLWRQENLKAAEEIADGVEQMQLEYGIDTNGDQVANQFVAADAIGAGRVVAIRVSLLLKSQQANLARKAQVYNFDGVAGINAPDKSLYTTFSTTIALRNRLN
jgi:type IV pilus assembly protein PilW